MIKGVFRADDTTAITMRVQNDNRSGCFHGTSVGVDGRGAEIAGISLDDFVEFLNVLGPGRSTLDLVTFRVYFKNAPNYYFECKITNRNIADIQVDDHDLIEETDGYLIRFKFNELLFLGEAVLPTFKWVRKKDKVNHEPKADTPVDRNEAKAPEKTTSIVAKSSDYAVMFD